MIGDDYLRIASRKKRIKESNDHTNYRNRYGILVPSVTTILKVIGKEALMQWANSLGWKRKSLNKELDDASLVGTMAHAYVEAYIFNDRTSLVNINVEIDSMPYELGNKVRKCIVSFMSWWKENSHHIKKVAYEVQLVTDFYGGTCDFVCYYDGELTIIDFKTSSDFHPTMYMQLAAYAKMYEQLYDVKVKRIAVLRLDKKEGRKAILKFINEVPGGDRSYYEMAFDCALNLHNAMAVINDDWGED